MATIKANVVCVTSSGGLPIFSRKIGDGDPLPFSTVGSLNGVHLFGKSKELILKSAESEHYNVIWEEYDDSIILVCVAPKTGVDLAREVIEKIYHAIIMFVGDAQIRNLKNVEPFKKMVRRAYPVIDCIMECFDLENNEMNPSMLGLVETTMCRESKTLKVAMDAFVDTIGTHHGFLTIEGCVAVATDGWWSISPIEKQILSLIIRTKSNCTSFDVPIYLPYTCPKTPLRFVSVCLISSIRVNALCGSLPDLGSITQKSYQCWSPIIKTLKYAVLTFPRSLATSEFHDSVQGFLLVNLPVGKCLMCASLKTTKKKCKSSSEKLVTFYHHASKVFTRKDPTHQPLETYWVAEYHKLHSLKEDDNVICILYHAGVPTSSMRYVTRQTLNLILSQGEQEWNHAHLRRETT
ncbi:establishment or maintenance of cell polarity [Nesidiocoris tenuis]|uniref:Establishment or maintenance of cell polarity n=1 Tax=Nesidiocoris tenuis TaxID=355587 RepID=A0ABN7A5J8_9HEMI|nr:establishment or maintenance of cell polarity [Nesidiocoris tenuis]